MVSSILLRRVSLALLVFQNLAYILLMRYARSRPGEDHFLPSSIVICSECIKLIVSSCMLTATTTRANELAGNNWLDSLKTGVPALIYLIQNQLLIAALSNVDAATFQVAYQLKLLTTAVFSVIILRRPISPIQWLALGLLFVGVIIVDPPADDGHTGQNPTLGFLYIVCASILSGLAGIYFELLLKSSRKSLWFRNVELSLVSFLLGLATQQLTERRAIASNGFFHGFDRVAWAVVGLHAFGGLLVGLVVKYADNVLKGFACSISIVLSCFYTVVYLGLSLSKSFVAGASMVLISVPLYSLFPPTSTVRKTIE